MTVDAITPAAEGHGLCPWMNALAFGRDVAPLGREEGYHGLRPWGSTCFSRKQTLSFRTNQQD
jgi:hypothetical protein